MKMNARQISCYLIVCTVILYSVSVAASDYADYSRRPLSEMFEVYSRFKANFRAGSNYNVGAASALIVAVGEKGGREVLPFLEEESLDPEMSKRIRSAAARAYVKIADVEESLNLMRKLYDDPSLRSWYDYVNKFFLQKVKSEEKSLTDEVKSDVCTHLLTIVQNTDSAGDALDAEFFLRDFLPGYTNSKQRATLVRYANTGNEYMTNNFNPIKAHFDKIPPKQRTDLRKRFPDLPPLPGDVPARSPVKVAFAIIAGIVAVVAAWLVLRRRKAHEAA
jgi:hypothetical protein